MQNSDWEKSARGPLIGFNLSGLLFKGGYIGGNMFDLKIDYPTCKITAAQNSLHKDEHPLYN